MLAFKVISCFYNQLFRSNIPPPARRRPGLVNCCNNVAALSAMRSVTRHTHPD